ncbi:MAG: hypothetical protein FJ319_00505 [SAR202 cluster bacterium]|nr:hypothetical protein [SAR202 cluster bacterium]
MQYIVAGALGGLAMTIVFMGVAPLVVFALARNPVPIVRPLLARLPPRFLVLALVLFAYPTFVVFGMAMGLLYRESARHIPGAGMGSPNLFFTLAIAAVGVALMAPFAVLLRRVAPGILALAAGWAAAYGWLLPLAADALARRGA